MENYQQRTFSIEAVLKGGWEVFKKNALMAIAGWIIAAIAMSFLGIVGDVIQQIGLHLGNKPIKIVCVLISAFLKLCNVPIQFWITGGMLFYFVKMARDESFSLGLLFPTDLKKVLNLMGVNILVALGVLVGLLFFIVPGIILGLMWSQSIYLVMDKDMGPIEAMKASTEMMRGNKINLFLLGLLFTVIGLAAVVVTCGLGVVVIGPLSVIIGACVYLAITE